MRVPLVPRLGRFFRNILTALGALVVAALLTPLPEWWARALAGSWNDPPGDVLIVLGSGLTAPGMIGESSYWRSVYATRVWRSGHFRKIVLSGDAPIIAPMREFLLYQQVPDASILLESRSTSTRENAEFTARLLSQEGGRKILLTSDFHMFRASRAFRKAGLDIVPHPFPDALKRLNVWPSRLTVVCELAVETAKIIYYKALGWI